MNIGERSGKLVEMPGLPKQMRQNSRGTQEQPDINFYYFSNHFFSHFCIYKNDERYIKV